MPVLLVLLILIVAIAVLGAAAFSLGLSLLWWAIIGLVIGGLGRLIIPGRHDIGLGVTILGGIAASLLGGVIARALEVGGFIQFLIAIILAALVVLYGPVLAGRSKA